MSHYTIREDRRLPPFSISRRSFVASALAGGLLGPFASGVRLAGAGVSDGASQVRGLLVGGVLGDALGGPVEFQSGSAVDAVLPCTRDWPPERQLDELARQTLAKSLALRPYDPFRPEAEPYAHWTDHAPAGTVTDDSRHKLVLLRTLRDAVARDQFPLTAQSLARQYVAFTPHADQVPTGELAELNEEGFREYRYAARWILGERASQQALPLERLWAGVPTCSGQMMLPPLAAAFPGQPEAAYKAAFALDFIDSPGARDMAAALVAGLAAVLGPDTLVLPVSERWQLLLRTMRETDPYRYAEVPFAGRPLNRWLDRAKDFARQAAGRPAKLFELLETAGRPEYWWDAHFTLLVPVSILWLCDFDPLAAMHLTLDFRHDTDSYAHVLGAMAGAVCGEEVFPLPLRQTVLARLQADYGESLEDWQQTLAECQARTQKGSLVESIEDSRAAGR